MVELSLNQTIRLLRLASLGKMIGGLVHNINGPMQNLGLDIDMSNHFLKNTSEQEGRLIKDFQTRLQRMEEEFNRIDRLIKEISVRADVHNEYFSFMNVNDYIENELEFHHANLYFKHNVIVNLEFQNDPPMVRDLPENSILALGWLITFLIEELENQEGEKIEVKTVFVDNSVYITFRIEKAKISEAFLVKKDQTPLSDGTPMGKEEDVYLKLAMAIFESNGISINNSISEQNSTEINLHIPIYK